MGKYTVAIHIFSPDQVSYLCSTLAFCKWWDLNPRPLNPFCQCCITSFATGLICFVGSYPPLSQYRMKQLSYSPRILYDTVNFLLIHQAFQPCTYTFSTVISSYPHSINKKVASFVKLSSPSAFTATILQFSLIHHLVLPLAHLHVSSRGFNPSEV